MFVGNIQKRMIFPNSKDRLLQALNDGGRLNKPIKIGELSGAHLNALNTVRLGKNWTPRKSGILTINQTDVTHMMKRITNDGLTPIEVVNILEHALSDDSNLVQGKNMRSFLANPTKLDYDNKPFTAQALIMDGDNWKNFRVYGVIPKGWSGRKK